MSTLLIEAKNLNRYYGKHCAVNDVSFSLAKGEVLGFLGPNGAGKTTTMQMLCGNLAPSSGEIIINGVDLLDKPKQAKKFLGYLPDTPPLYKELTVNEFLRYCGTLHGLSFRKLELAVSSAKHRCGLSDMGERLIINLSKGYQQRVGIAQAILHNPDVIVLDEPTVGLDPIQIKEIRSLIKELGEEHGIILSTHILSEVQESCTHVQIINQGKLILKEDIETLNQRMNAETLKVVTRLPLDQSFFSGIPSIKNIDHIAETIYLIQYDSHHNPTELIADIIVDSNWGLQELSPIKTSMEDIFISVTSEDEERLDSSSENEDIL